MKKTFEEMRIDSKLIKAYYEDGYTVGQKSEHGPSPLPTDGAAARVDNKYSYAVPEK